MSAFFFEGAEEGNVLMFIDKADIEVKAGDGGAGKVSFRREKYVAKGGPDGGDGGAGGSVVFVADHNLKSLMDLKYQQKYHAPDGHPGERRNRSGCDGEDLIIRLPVGTLVMDMATGLPLHDLTVDGQQIIVAKGGKGGKGNARFATSTRQTPYYAQKGLAGESFEVILELKLIADVGIIGLPNVGKSSLISKITSSRPKIADYPFTTLVPNLGVVRYRDGKQYVIADIPGIIEGAHEGHGLGTQFLRHVERTTVLLHMLDVSDFYVRDVVADYRLLSEELRLHNPEILKKEQLIVLNKIDAVQDRARLIPLKKAFPKKKVYMISAVTGEGIEELQEAIIKRVEIL